MQTKDHRKSVVAANIDIRFNAGFAARAGFSLFLKLLSVLAPACLCFAQVQLPAVNLGETNFEDGFALPGWLLEEFPETYVAAHLRDAHGKAIPGLGRLISDVTNSHVAYISNKHILGATLAAEILQPLVDLDVRSATGASTRLRGFGDLTLGPGLQWAPRKVRSGIYVHRLAFDVTVPTGTYSDRRPINIGNHFVSVDPYYSLTYERKKIEVSARAHYLWNSTNHDPFAGFGIRNMQPGQAFHLNYATSYEVRKSVRLGFNGYWLQQTTDHRINGVGVPDSKERTVGLGPGIQFGSQSVWFRVNSYFETDVRNRSSGLKVTLRISKAISAGKT